MRKLVLVLPAAAVLLAAGVLLGDPLGSFAAAVPDEPTAAVATPAPADVPAADWQETSRPHHEKPKSKKEKERHHR